MNELLKNQIRENLTKHKHLYISIIGIFIATLLYLAVISDIKNLGDITFIIVNSLLNIIIIYLSIPVLLLWIYFEKKKINHFTKYKHIYMFLLLVNILPILFSAIFDNNLNSFLELSFEVMNNLKISMIFLPALFLGFSELKYKWQIMITSAILVIIFGLISTQTCTGKFCGIFGLFGIGFSTGSFLMFLEGAYYNTWGKYIGYAFILLGMIIIFSNF